MDSHNVHPIERFRAVRAFAHAVCEAILDTMIAEQMTTTLQDSILEILSANRTQSKHLYNR
jgi:hypothetical protein